MSPIDPCISSMFFLESKSEAWIVAVSPMDGIMDVKRRGVT